MRTIVNFHGTVARLTLPLLCRKAEYSQVARRAGMIASFRAKALTIVRDAERKKAFMTYVAQEKTKGKLLDVDSSLVTEVLILCSCTLYL